jgi:hypothetical protein
MDRSLGHIMTIGAREFYARNGLVYVADTATSVGTDGYRVGYVLGK